MGYMPEKNDCQSGRWYYKHDKDYDFWVKYMHMDREDNKVVNTLLGGSEEGTDGVLHRIDLDHRTGTGKWYWWIVPFVNYVIVDTDYDNYAVIYGCNDWGVFHTRQAWLYGRTPGLKDSFVDLAKKALDYK